MLNLKVNAVAICALKALGLVHSEHFMEIMKDMKQLTSVPSPATISVEMVAAGSVFVESNERGAETKMSNAPSLSPSGTRMVTTGSLAESMMLLMSGTVLCSLLDVSYWLTIQKINRVTKMVQQQITIIN